MFTTIHHFLHPLRRPHVQIRDAVVAACETAALEALSAVAQEEAGDTIYAVDRVSEELPHRRHARPDVPEAQRLDFDRRGS